MARIENYDKIKRNVIVVDFDESKIDLHILNQIKALEQQLASLRRQAKRITVVYVPERHSLFEKRLLREGRIVTLADCIKKENHLSEWNSLHMVEYIDDINSLENILPKETLNRLRYDGEKYKKVTLVFCDGKEILRLSGVQEKNLI